MSNDGFKRKMGAIAQAVSSGQYRYTIHGAQQRIARGLHRSDIKESIASGEIIEDYPEHHYGPCSLVYGTTKSGKVLHLVCSNRPRVDIITVYEPDLVDWEADLKTRRRKP